MITKTTTKDILQQYNQNNRDFYIEAIFAEDISNKEKGVLAVLTQEDMINITDVLASEIGGWYSKEEMESDILGTDGYVLVARLRHPLNGHKPDEIIGVAVVYNGCTNVAQQRNYFFAKQLTEAYLAQIAVRKDVRDKDDPNCIRGMGTALFDCVRQIAKMQGHQYVTLESVEDTDTLKFYSNKGMLKSNGFLMRFTKVLSPNVETVARVTFNIMEYMQQHRIHNYKQFVNRYKWAHGNDISDLIGNIASKDKEIVAKMMLDISPNSMQTSTIFNVKRVVNEIFSAYAKPDLTDYLEYMYHCGIDKNDDNDNSRSINENNIYLRRIKHESVVQQMPQKQQQNMLYIFNTVKLMEEDKIIREQM